MMDSSSPQKKHPSQGGNAYSQDMPEEVITRFQLGLPMNTPELTAFRIEYQYPSVWTCWRYIQQFLEEGLARPNKIREIACLSVKFLGIILFDWRCIELCIQRPQLRRQLGWQGHPRRWNRRWSLCGNW